MKKEELSRQAKRQIELLKRHYKVDEENRIVTISLHYEKVSEIVEKNIGDYECPLLKHDVLRKISLITHTVPKEFKINVELHIENYEGLSPDKIVASIKDGFELFRYDIDRERGKNKRTTAKLALIGILALAALFFFASKQWLGVAGDMNRDILHELVYALAISVSWECVYHILLPKNHFSNISFTIFSYLEKFDLYGPNDTFIENAYTRESVKEWIVDSKKEAFYRELLLVSSTAFVALGEIGFFAIISLITGPALDHTKIIILLFNIFFVIFFALSGIAGNFFLNEKGKFGKSCVFLGPICIAFSIADVVVLSLVGVNDFSILIYSIMFAVISAIYTLSSIVMTKLLKKRFY